MNTVSVDLARFPVADERSKRVREKVETLVDYMAKAGKKPGKVDIFPGDHRHLLRSMNSALRRQAREQDRLENERRKADGAGGGQSEKRAQQGRRDQLPGHPGGAGRRLQQAAQGSGMNRDISLQAVDSLFDAEFGTQVLPPIAPPVDPHSAAAQPTPAPAFAEARG